MMDPAGFSTREAWLAYLMGYQDGRREYEDLLKPPVQQTP